MTPTELVKNFVKQYRKPFAAETIAGYTTIETAEIKPILQDLTQTGLIKEVETGIFVNANRYNPVLCYGQKGTWNFHPNAANQLLNLIENGSYTSIRKITADFPRSRQWVFVYLEALASIDAIGFDKVYYVKSRARLKEIGKHIKKGILHELTCKPPDPNAKTQEQLRAEAAERRRLRQEKKEAESKSRQAHRAYRAAKKTEWEKIKSLRRQANEMCRLMAEDYKQRYSN